MHPEVNDFLKNTKKWHDELSKLIAIVVSCGLAEDFKWRTPCYTFKGNNVVVIGNYKSYCSLSFFKGVLLKDAKNILESPGPNSRYVKLIKFDTLEDIMRLESTLRNYIQQAIEVEKSGLKIDFEKNEKWDYPEELEKEFLENYEFKLAFENLTLGRQRGYLLYFSGAKQSKTRASRIKKYKDRILDGKGFHDCVCGLSKNMPNCDGSHNNMK